MNSSPSLSSITAPLGHFFGKYHATVFFTFITLLLAGAILSLYLTTQSTTATDTTTGDVISSEFDTKTADEIQKLRESNQATSDLVYPSPRSNPFIE